MFVDSPYKEITRKIVHAFSDGIKHGWIGCSLPRLFHAAGLTEVTCVPHAVRPYCAFTHRIFDGHLARAQQAGVLLADGLMNWWQHLEQAEAAGQFYRELPASQLDMPDVIR